MKPIGRLLCVTAALFGLGAVLFTSGGVASATREVQA